MFCHEKLFFTQNFSLADDSLHVSLSTLALFSKNGSLVVPFSTSDRRKHESGKKFRRKKTFFSQAGCTSKKWDRLLGLSWICSGQVCSFICRKNHQKRPHGAQKFVNKWSVFALFVNGALKTLPLTKTPVFVSNDVFRCCFWLFLVDFFF